MQKNVSGQKLLVFAFTPADGLPVTGDAANITAYVTIDGGTVTALADTSAVEKSSTNAAGYYQFDLAQAETNGDALLFTAKSSTSGVVVVAAPAMVFTTPPNFAAQNLDSSGRALLQPAQPGTTFDSLTVTGATTLTGNVALAAGLTITQSSSNAPAVSFTGNGTGAGLLSTGGTTGRGATFTGGGTSGNGVAFLGTGGLSGLYAQGLTGDCSGVQAIGSGTGAGMSLVANGSGDGLEAFGGATGRGFHIRGGGTSGAALALTTTSGDGIEVTPTAGNGITVTANGTSKHGIVVTGGTAGTSDGLKAVAGTGGVPIRGDITGNITGNLSGNVGGSVASVTAAVTLTSAYDFAKGTVAMTEDYAANGVEPTPIEAIYAIHQMLQDFAISGTTYTVKRLDNSTTAFVCTLNSATPTGIART